MGELGARRLDGHGADYCVHRPRAPDCSPRLPSLCTDLSTYGHRLLSPLLLLSFCVSAGEGVSTAQRGHCLSARGYLRVRATTTSARHFPHPLFTHGSTVANCCEQQHTYFCKTATPHDINAIPCRCRSKELFVNEYRAMLAERLLGKADYDTDKEARTRTRTPPLPHPCPQRDPK